MEPRKLFTERKPRRVASYFTPSAGGGAVAATASSTARSGSKAGDSRKFAFLAEQLGEYRCTIRQLRKEIADLKEGAMENASSGASVRQKLSKKEVSTLQKQLEAEREARLRAEKRVSAALGKQLAEQAAREAIYQERRAKEAEKVDNGAITSSEFYRMVSEARQRRREARLAEALQADDAMRQATITSTRGSIQGQTEFYTPWNGERTSRTPAKGAAGPQTPACDFPGRSPAGGYSVRSTASGARNGVSAGFRSSKDLEPSMNHLFQVEAVRMASGPVRGSRVAASPGPATGKQCPVTPGVFFRALTQADEGKGRGAVAKAAARGDRRAVEALATAAAGGAEAQQMPEADVPSGAATAKTAEQKGATFSRLSSRVSGACRALNYKALNGSFEEAGKVFGGEAGGGQAWLCKLADSCVMLRQAVGAAGGGPRARRVPVLVFVAGASAGGDSAGALPARRCVRALLRNHANINATDPQGRTAVDAAEEAGNKELAGYLRGKGGVEGARLAAPVEVDSPVQRLPESSTKRASSAPSPVARAPPRLPGPKAKTAPSSPGALLLAGQDEGHTSTQIAPTSREAQPPATPKARGSTRKVAFKLSSGGGTSRGALSERRGVAGVRSPLASTGGNTPPPASESGKGRLARGRLGAGDGAVSVLSHHRSARSHVPGVSSPLARGMQARSVAGRALGSAGKGGAGAVGGASSPRSPSIKWMR